MRFHLLIFSLLVLNFVSIVPVEGVSGIVYKETLETYARIDDETFRWETFREFILKDYTFIKLNPFLYYFLYL